MQDNLSRGRQLWRQWKLSQIFFAHINQLEAVWSTEALVLGSLSELIIPSQEQVPGYWWLFLAFLGFGFTFPRPKPSLKEFGLGLQLLTAAYYQIKHWLQFHLWSVTYILKRDEFGGILSNTSVKLHWILLSGLGWGMIQNYKSDHYSLPWRSFLAFIDDWVW